MNAAAKPRRIFVFTLIWLLVAVLTIVGGWMIWQRTQQGILLETPDEDLLALQPYLAGETLHVASQQGFWIKDYLLARVLVQHGEAVRQKQVIDLCAQRALSRENSTRISPIAVSEITEYFSSGAKMMRNPVGVSSVLAKGMPRLVVSGDLVDYHDQHTREALAEFEEQLGAGRLDNCASTLTRLITLNLDKKQYKELDTRLQAALAGRAREAEIARDQHLFEVAKALNTKEDWKDYLKGVPCLQKAEALAAIALLSNRQETKVAEEEIARLKVIEEAQIAKQQAEEAAELRAQAEAKAIQDAAELAQEAEERRICEEAKRKQETEAQRLREKEEAEKNRRKEEIAELRRLEEVRLSKERAEQEEKERIRLEYVKVKAQEAKLLEVSKFDIDAWVNATELDTEASYAVYLGNQPQGNFRKEAEKYYNQKRSERLELEKIELETNEAQKRDELRWKDACNVNTLDAYQRAFAALETDAYKSKIELQLKELAKNKNYVWTRVEFVLSVLGVLVLIWLNLEKKQRLHEQELTAIGIEAVARSVGVYESTEDKILAHADVPPSRQVFPDTFADGIEMVTIPAGSFDMGSKNGESNEKPVRRVTFAKPFAISKTEVTQGQWKAVVGSNPSYFKDCGDNCPVEQVSWDDAKVFIQKLNAKTGQQYRLPTESEWEYASRAGGTHKYSGSDNIEAVAWHGDNSGYKTHPVAQKQKNAYGLYDMSGNVWEWVEDSYHDNYKGAPTDGSAWSGDGAKRVLRSGSWNGLAQFTRAAFRYGSVPSGRIVNYFGFRLARTLPSLEDVQERIKLLERTLYDMRRLKELKAGKIPDIKPVEPVTVSTMLEANARLAVLENEIRKVETSIPRTP